MNIFSRIKQLVVRRQIILTLKVEIELMRDNLDEEDLIESVVNAVGITKTLRSRNPKNGLVEKLYIIKGRTFSGINVYSKGKIVKSQGVETFYVFISGKRQI